MHCNIKDTVKFLIFKRYFVLGPFLNRYRYLYTSLILSEHFCLHNYQLTLSSVNSQSRISEHFEMGKEIRSSRATVFPFSNLFRPIWDHEVGIGQNVFSINTLKCYYNLGKTFSSLVKTTRRYLDIMIYETYWR